ncbi:MAG: TerB family tellurite resistance protein [SAR324 cluster bacterium]|nr:TerB family tellurite resistance protein [SAR324 cluster bacterium]
MISTGLRPDQLDTEQKNWYAVAICGAIIADGNVAPEELLYLEKALSFLPSREKVASLIQAVKDQKIPPLDTLKSASRETQSRMLVELTSVMSADNTLSSREMDYLFNIGKKLGFEREFVQAIMRWANEGIMLRNKLSHLLRVGTELEPEY